MIYSFSGYCRGRLYDYEVTERGNEYLLSSYSDGELVDRVTWIKNEHNLEIILSACFDIESR